MDTQVLKRIFDGRKDLLALPQTLAEVLRLVRDEDSDARDLANVLSKDPALTTRVLRIVNSPFFGVGREIGSMTQAVMTLGMRQVTAIALSTSVYRLTNNWESGFDRIRFWRHSLEVAIASRLIADAAGHKRREEAFAAGLLHDIGLLILGQSFPDDFPSVWERGSREGNLCDLEEETWGTNHAKVGQFLLEQWNLPDDISRAVGMHHTIFVPGTNDDELASAQIVGLANRISQFAIYAETRDGMGLDPENVAIIRDNLGIAKTQLQNISRKLFQQTVEEARFLDLDIGSADDILLEANQLLFDQYVTVENLLQENRQMQKQIMRDQLSSVALESLKSTTASFARHLENAAMRIRSKVSEVSENIEQEQDPSRAELLGESLQVIVTGIDAVCSMSEELRHLATIEPNGNGIESEISQIETKVREKLQMLEEAGVR